MKQLRVGSLRIKKKVLDQKKKKSVFFSPRSNDLRRSLDWNVFKEESIKAKCPN